jgi:hypothetical protein
VYNDLEQAPPENYDEAAAWSEINKRVRLFRVVENCSLLAMFIAVIVVSPPPHTSGGWEQIAVFLAVFSCIAVACIQVKKRMAKYVHSFPCPRCKREFAQVNLDFSNSLRGILLSKSSVACKGCGFIIWNPEWLRNRNHQPM